MRAAQFILDLLAPERFQIRMTVGVVADDVAFTVRALDDRLALPIDELAQHKKHRVNVVSRQGVEQARRGCGARPVVERQQNLAHAIAGFAIE